MTVRRVGYSIIIRRRIKEARVAGLHALLNALGNQVVGIVLATIGVVSLIKAVS